MTIEELKIGSTLQNGKYMISKVLGAGSFGISYLATTKLSINGPLGKMEVAANVAIKEFYMKDLNCRVPDKALVEGTQNPLVNDYRQKFRKEAINLSKLHHKNIVKVIDVFDENNTTYYVMEYVKGGTLDDYIHVKGKLAECEALDITMSVGEALAYMHTNKMLHLDMKPKNIMRDTKGNVFLIDFGLSKVFSGDDNTMKGAVGTTFYMAPEVITGKYNEKCDVWACGVILYIMLCGKPPFYSKDEEELKQKICSMKFDFNYPEFAKVSNDAKELIASMLVDKEHRPSVPQVLNHKWIKENAPHSTNEGLNINWNHIKKYSGLNLMQKSVINFTAFRLTEDETRQFVEVFKSLDENSDGVLTMEEIKKGIDLCNFGKKMNSNEIIKMFNEMDVDKNGLINFTEFVSAMMDYDKFVKKEQLLECFRSYDTDGSGKISFEEFCDMIKPSNEQEKKDLFILYKKFDTNNDGEIDFEEFVNGFNNIN